MTRKPRKSPSHPRLEAEGWDDREATDVIDLALERVKKTTADAEEKLRVSREDLSRCSRELHGDIETTVKQVAHSVPPPPAEEAAAASR